MSFMGNIVRMDGAPFLHAHAVVSRRDGTTVGGHVLSARVSVTLEIFLTRVGIETTRKLSRQCGLNCWSSDADHARHWGVCERPEIVHFGSSASVSEEELDVAASRRSNPLHDSGNSDVPLWSTALFTRRAHIPRPAVVDGEIASSGRRRETPAAPTLHQKFWRHLHERGSSRVFFAVVGVVVQREAVADDAPRSGEAAPAAPLARAAAGRVGFNRPHGARSVPSHTGQ